MGWLSDTGEGEGSGSGAIAFVVQRRAIVALSDGSLTGFHGFCMSDEGLQTVWDRDFSAKRGKGTVIHSHPLLVSSKFIHQGCQWDLGSTEKRARFEQGYRQDFLRKGIPLIPMRPYTFGIEMRYNNGETVYYPDCNYNQAYAQRPEEAGYTYIKEDIPSEYHPGQSMKPHHFDKQTERVVLEMEDIPFFIIRSESDDSPLMTLAPQRIASAANIQFVAATKDAAAEQFSTTIKRRQGWYVDEAICKKFPALFPAIK